ncbi:hypothetical protein [Allokutzneria oryzae]|uniref:NUDIX hydrolase n=1 Tax=Allokutzneria oryzae TaxID=1378989 RepID=A0ABV5ZZH5_9PSEU
MWPWNGKPFCFGLYDEPGRDPRGEVRSFDFTAAVPSLLKARAGDDAKNVKWVPVADALTGEVPLAFDHVRILRNALTVLATLRR